MRKLTRQNILITGGAGFIGSILTFYLKKSFKIFVIDDLSIGRQEQVRTKNFYKFSITNKKKLDLFFKKNSIDFVIHLAGHSNLRESKKKPRKYYINNYSSTKNLIDCMIEYKVKNIIFSSTASVYGSYKKMPLKENYPTKPISIYGKTKLKAEKYIINKSRLNYRYIIFRFFNVAGALSKSKLGETKTPPEHFIPIAIRQIINGKKVTIFNNFNTKDGTGCRDYIHVKDIALAHHKAITYLQKKINKSLILNLGSTKSVSAMKITQYLSTLLKNKINLIFFKKKHGEPDILQASFSAARKKINWIPRKNIIRILKDSIAWENFIKKNKLF